MSRFLELLAAAVVAAALAGSAFAQQQSSAPAGGGSVQSPTGAAPSRSGVIPPDEVPGQAAPGGIQGQNIFDVKPEVKRDASNDSGYLQQNNAQRNAVQPGNNAPMWRGVQSGREGYSSLPKSEAPEAGVLIQAPVAYPGQRRMVTAGQAWREFRNNWIIPYGGALLIIVLVALGITYFAKGPLGHATNQGVRRIERFTPFERSAHWTNAIAFCALGISGIVMAFGKFFLLPVMGLTLFGYFTYILKNLHNFFGPLFAVSLLVVIVTFIKDNLPQRGDLRWLLRMGGLFGKKGELPSHRFNAMEKVVFWTGTLVLGVIVVGSGLVMDKLIPNVLYVRQTMQVTNMVHATAAALMLAILFLHIYVGTVGIRGSYTAMRTGYVDDAWAEEHHAYWYEDIRAGRVPVQRTQALTMPDDRTDRVRPA